MSAIPVELRDRRQWVTWKFEQRPGETKPTKVPYRADGRGGASAIDPGTWTTFEKALAAVERRHMDGIGYVFAADDPYTGIDIDECFGQDGRLHPDAGAILAELDSYAELSPSGHGVHVFVRANLDGYPRHRTSDTRWGGHFEVYDHGRFFTVTGELVRGCPDKVEERQGPLNEVLARFLPAPAPQPAPPRLPQPVELDDRELLERMFKWETGPEIERLWNGVTSDYGDDDSRADYHLCRHLAYATACDPDRIERMFRASRLYRDKWERPDYRELTITAAIKATNDVYQPATTSSLTSSRPRPQRDEVEGKRPRPSSPPLTGDEDEVVSHLVPDLVPPPSSWLPCDIVARAARPPEPPEIIDLLYPGNNHLLSGESEALKTWLTLIAAAEELAAGRGVYWADGDDVGSGALLERLRLLGVDDHAIGNRFAYALPDEPLDGPALAGVLEVVRSHACRLAVFDGFNPLLVLHGLNPNEGTDVETFYRLLAPIKNAPTAVVITDNVVKAPEARGGWAIGSERKRSKAEVHLDLRPVVKLVRGGTGKALITVRKDRPGFLERPSPGVLVLDTTDGACAWRIEPDTSHSDEGEFRPTGLMERVSRHLEVHGEPVSRDQVEKNVPGKAEYLRMAMERLTAEGYATEFPGPRKARMLRLERPFREAEDAGRVEGEP